MKRSHKLGLTALGMAGAASVLALVAIAAPTPTPSKASLAGTRVDNFMLADQTGMGHELYYFKEKAAVVIVTAAEGDAVSDRAKAALAKIQDAFKGKNVHFVMLDSSLKSKHDSFDGVPGSAALPVLADELQLVGRSLGVTQTGEAFVIDPKSWKVAYHGPIDDSFADKKVANGNLTSALNAVIAGKAPSVTEVAVKGSVVDFPDRAKAAELRQHFLHDGRRADPRGQVRRLSHRGRHGPVRDGQVRGRQDDGADDPRSTAHQAHASVPLGSRTVRCGPTTCAPTRRSRPS
jgi:hypothetical protein